jgi:hypothetical protein
MASAYGLGLYNVIGALILVLFAKSIMSDPGLWAGAILHIVMSALFIYAFVKRR